MPIEIEQDFNILQSRILKHFRKGHFLKMNPYMKAIKESITRIKNNPMIKITQSDKNLGLVIFSIHQYHQKILKLLDSPIYKTMDHTTAEEWNDDIFGQFDYNIVNMLSLDEFKFANHGLKRDQLQLAIFHGIPKIHKSTNLDTLPFRPIVASRPHLLQSKISTILVERLQQNMIQYPHILKNTLDLLTKIDHLNTSYVIDHNIGFLTFDFDSLYSNIPLDDLYHQLDIKEYKKHLPLFKFIFNNNVFEYNGQIYQQCDGIAMGTNVAPTVANLYLALKIDHIIANLPGIIMYGRYIDDAILVVDLKTISSINVLVDKIKDLVKPLTITYKYDNHTIDFLDINLFTTNNKIQSKIYQKPINKYLYLPATSYHPPHILKGFIHSEINRYNKYCTTAEDFTYIKSLFITRLMDRGYSLKTIRSAIGKKRKTAQSDKDTPFIPITLRYTKQLSMIKNIQKELNDFGEIYGLSLKLIHSMSPNLRKTLMRSALTKEQQNALTSNHLLLDK